MNSEELELSLRTEFESYLKDFLADMRQEVSEFRKNFETEFEKHKAQTDEALRRLVERFEKNIEFDQAFNESVIEHLRLARDEGATITAVAIGEAEKLKEEAAPADYDKLRDAINEISSKTSQSEILKSLVDHASNFAPRGAFFIVKNEQFVGWRGFGDETAADDATIRSIHFPMSADTILADSVGALATTAAGAGAHADNGLFLDALQFGTPDRMYAIPLVARGRGVAVLYADYGSEGITLQPEALETLVRVAGLTVELAAAGVQPVPAVPPVDKTAVHQPTEEERSAGTAPEEVEAADYAETVEDSAAATEQWNAPSVEEPTSYEPVAAAEEPAVEEVSPVANFEEYTAITVEEQSVSFEEVSQEEPVGRTAEYPVDVVEEALAGEQPADEVPVERFGEIVEQPADEVTYFEPVEDQVVTESAFSQPGSSFEPAPAEAKDEFPEVIDEPVSQPVNEYVPQSAPVVESGNGAPAVAEPAAEAAAPMSTRTRYRDRNIDLPIEVPEDERRLHHDARRFARLLVSEIKLYNEQKVTDGREAGDLYDRLREAIDRSREMYDKRVQQPVADKFDYFHYELVNSLAEGNDVKLGASYPGSRVAA